MPDGNIVDNVPDDITQEALLAQYQTFKGASAPVEQPAPVQRAEPGSVSYALQGAGAGLETAGRMVGQMVGGGAGALGAGIAAIPDVLAGRTEQAAEGIKRGMEEGAQRGVAPFEASARLLTGQPTMYAPTQQFEQALGQGMEATKEHLGTVAELAETARGTLAQKIAPEALQGMVGPQGEAARTTAEYGFDAGAVVAPWLGLRGIARQQARMAAVKKADILKEHTPPPADLGPREIARQHIEGLKEMARDSDPKAYVVPQTETPAVAGAEVPMGDLLRRFQERGGEQGVAPLAEAESAARAVREFQQRGAAPELPAGPGRKQMGAVGDLSELPIEQRLRFRYKIIDTQTNSVVTEAYNKTRARNIRDKLDNEYGAVRHKVVEYITDPFKGPGKRQAGALDLEWAKPVRKTEFEIEQGLEKGQGLALPDLTTPLDVRAAETLKVGRDLAAADGKAVFERLPNDMSKLTTLAGNTEHITKYTGVNNPLVKAVVDRYTEKTQAVDALREDLLYGDQLRTGAFGISALRHTKRASARGFKGPLDQLGKADQMKLADLNLDSDASRSYLKEKGQQWFTREDMAQRGYSETVIKAHLHEQAYMDTVMDIVNYARSLGGKAPLKPIPGWLPHTRAGHMRIKILRKMADGTEHVEYYGKSSGSKSALLREAQKVIDEMKSKTPGVEFKVDIARADDVGGMAELIDHFESVSAIYGASETKFSQMIANSMNKRIAGMEQGFLQEGFRRYGVKGWIGETGVTNRNLNQLKVLRENYIENALRYLKSQEIQAIRNQISEPVWQDLTKHLPQSADFITKFTEVARENVPLNTIDTTLMDLFSAGTGERFRYRLPLIAASKLRSLFSMKDLMWSTSYHASNAIQPEVIGSSALVREASRMGKGNPATAIMYGEKNIWAPSLEAKERITWAAKHKVHNARLMEEIDLAGGKVTSWVTGRRLSEINEAFGRLKTFLMGTEFYRSTGMTELQARQAAMKLVNDVMVDYSAIGQPLWLSNNPFGQTVGRLVAPYAAFQFNFLGQLALAMQAIKRNPGVARKLLPLVSQQMAIGTFAGFRGLTGIKEIALATTLFNSWWQTTFNEEGPLPNIEEILMKNKIAKDFTLFGAIGAASKWITPDGVDLMQSAASPDLPSFLKAQLAPRVGEGAVDVIANVFPVLIKVLFNQEISDSDKMAAFKAVTPSAFMGYLEAAFAPDLGETPSERIVVGSLAQAGGYVPDPRKQMRGVIERTPAEWATRIWTGKPSLSERRKMETGYRVEASKQRAGERKGDIRNLAADSLQQDGVIDPDLTMRAVEEGIAPRRFRREVKELVKEREQTRLQRLRGKKRTPTRDRVREQIEDMLDDLEP